MKEPRFRLSSAVTILYSLTAIFLPAPASAQLTAHAARTSSSVVASQLDSMPGAGSSSGGSVAPDSDGAAYVEKALRSPSGEKGSGLSGKVFARFVMPEDWISLASLPGAQLSTASVQGGPAPSPETVFTMRSFGQKVRALLNGYRLGYWPAEKGRRLRSEAYKNPDGFIEVTPENEDTRVSEHFRLRDFISHGQENVWPKYVVLREPLLDKLELIIEDLNDHGVNAEGMRIRSGFRTPARNTAVRGEGSARDSRHQFGDAADVYIDHVGNGKMSDLNGDGRVNFADAKMILDAVERVEARYPELVGGTGLYASSGKSGPFAHIDVRGVRARWVRGVYKGRSRSARSSRKPSAKASASKAPAKTSKSASASRGKAPAAQE